MPFAFAVFFTFLTFAHAQYSEQPAKESNADLRSQTAMFSIEIPGDKKTYTLERTASSDYLLRLKAKKDESIKKVAGREALRMDRDFAARFLRCQYEIPAKEGECEVTLRLTMKGETQDICEKDDKKTQEMESFITELATRF